MKRFKQMVFLLLLAFLFCNTKLTAQLQPSVYTGFGMPNLGGVIGVGAEIKYKWISFNIAAGPSFSSQDNMALDAGIKVYSKIGIFGGVNYGAVRTKGNGSWSWKEDVYGFSFTAGYRRTIYKHIYGLGFVGVTSDKLTFMKESERKHDLIPRCGLLIGYEF